MASSLAITALGRNPVGMHFHLRRALTLALLCLTTACSFYSTASNWNGRVDVDGKPVFVKITTNVGFNLGVIVPVIGNTTIDEMVEITTREIARHNSDGVRVFQTTSENYWYGFPPFTWVLTPVITTVAIEYTPSERELQLTAADDRDRAPRRQ